MKTPGSMKYFATVLLALMLASCANPPRPVAPAAPAIAWPPAPAEARIVYVRELRGPRDIGQSPSIWHNMGHWLTGDRAETPGLRKPFAVALDETGNLCITDTDARAAFYCDFARKRWQRFDGAGKIKFSSPVGIARRHGIFYVADSELGKVLAFGDDGKLRFEIATTLQRPVGLAIAGESLVVVDAAAHAVLVFGLDGKFQFRFGKRGTGPGEFNFPTCVAADNRGHLLVSDTLNSRVQVFDLAGKYVSQFGSNGDTSGHFARPKGVTADAAGNCYVVDALFDNFQIFNPEGRLLLNVGEAGNRPGEFALPHGIAMGADNKIYVADAFNHRVQIFQYLGQP